MIRPPTLYERLQAVFSELVLSVDDHALRGRSGKFDLAPIQVVGELNAKHLTVIRDQICAGQLRKCDCLLGPRSLPEDESPIC